MPDAEQFKLCSTCKKPIAFGSQYYQCSVSTCTRPRVGLFFCSVECWDAHLPMMRHREAWAERVTAPTKAEVEREEQEELAKENRAKERNPPMTDPNDPNDKQRRIVGSPSEPTEKDILIVVSKMKAYIRAASGMNTADGVAEVLSDRVRTLCDAAIAEAKLAGRKTVMPRDFREPRE
jgi:hypothetical protein